MCVNADESVNADGSVNANVCNIIKAEKGRYTVDITEDPKLIENKIVTYRNNFYKIDNLAKPVKAFSSYSLTDLIKICDNLKISVTTPDGKKQKKKELYTEILKHFLKCKIFLKNLI